MSKIPSLKKILHKIPKVSKKDLGDEIKELQKELLIIQQGLWHKKARAIFLFEGFDAAGKGGTIKTITEMLDPRGVAVHAIAAPDPKDQAKHYLYRFWKELPEPGVIAIFDRSWYGRVLVEKVDKLISPERIEQAYEEIRNFEQTLLNDGILIFKFFLAISPEEQLERYEERLKNPYKQWKLGEDDIRARRKWSDYVNATDDLFKETSTKASPWHLIAADHKAVAHKEVLTILTEGLSEYAQWMQGKADLWLHKKLKKELKDLKKI